MLLLALYPDAKPPLDPSTGEEVEDAKARVEYLIESLDNDGATVIVPTPVLAEVLIKAGSRASDIVDILNTRSVFQIADFDQMAAIETAASLADSIRRGGIKVDAADQNTTKSKVRVRTHSLVIART